MVLGESPGGAPAGAAAAQLAVAQEGSDGKDGCEVDCKNERISHSHCDLVSAGVAFPPFDVLTWYVELHTFLLDWRQVLSEKRIGFLGER